MMEDKQPTKTVEVDLAFLKSKRGLLKILEMGVVFVAFVCFAVASRPPYITATSIELLTTLAFILLYLLKLNKFITFFFWPLIDVFNSFFAAAFIFIISVVAVSTYTGKATLAGGVSSFISFVCFCASTAAAFVTAPLIFFLTALFLLFAYSTKFNERFKGFQWPLMDFLRCVSASVIFFIISIIAVASYPDGSSKAAGIFGFIATIIFALDFYFIFNELADFLKGGGSREEPQNTQDADSDSDSD